MRGDFRGRALREGSLLRESRTGGGGEEGRENQETGTSKSPITNPRRDARTAPTHSPPLPTQDGAVSEQPLIL